MKHLIKLAFLLLALLPATANAQYFEVDGIYYNILDDNKVAVTCLGQDYFQYLNECFGSVTIPSSVTYNCTTYSVTSIGEMAFYGCSGLTSVVIGNSVTSIGNEAFSSCSRLTSIDIPNSVTTIGNEAFYNCSSLPSVTIPNSVTTIGYNAFRDCGGLASIDIPNSVTAIGSDAFYGTAWYNNQPDGLVYAGLVAYKYKGTMPEGTIITLREGTKGIASEAFVGWSTLTHIDIPNSVTSIGLGAFYGCIGLTSVTIPNSVTTIGDHAFYGCSGLNSVTISNSVTTIDSWTFYNCNSLTSIDIPNSVTSIGNSAFSGSGLTSVTIGNSVTSIGNFAFYNCSSLTSIDIPNSVTSIGNSAFSGSDLTSIEIPNSVTSIGDEAFYNCSSLTSIEIPNSVTTIGSGAFYCTAWYNNQPNGLVYAGLVAYKYKGTMPQGTSISLQEGTKGIAGNAFSYCIGLTSIDIPNSVISIGDYAFSGCSGLTSVDIPNSVTTIGHSAFSYCIGLNEVYSHISDPASISMGSDVFYRYPANYDERKLYVPAGTSAAYEADTRWSDYFGSIVEMGNYFTIPGTTVMHGDTIVVPVKMFNEASVISFQTDIFLPEGLELLQEDGEYIIDPSERMTRTHSIMSDNVSNGSIRVLCYSSNYKPFTGNSGDDLFYLTLKVADDAEGDYTIQLKNTLLTNTDFVDMPAPDVAATVNVKAYILGDANNSRLVTVGDVVATAQYVLEQNPQPFIFEAADVNFDGNITVADVSRIAWMVLNPGAKAPRRAPAVLNSGDRMSGEGISLMPGETRRVSIALDNAMEYNAFQLDLSLPEGLTASNFQLTDRAGSHAFDVNTLGGGKFRALCYSPALTAISGHEGALLTFDVTANAAVTGAITVDGIELVTTACESVRLDGFAIDVNSASGVNEQVAGKTVARVDYYNLAGQQIDRPEAGVTLVVTTYTDGTRATTKIVR